MLLFPNSVVQGEASPPLDTDLLLHNGDISEEDLLQASQGSLEEQCVAHYEIGLHRLAIGDRGGAIEHLRRVVETRQFRLHAFSISRFILRMLDMDPYWPPWIQ